MMFTCLDLWLIDIFKYIYLRLFRDSFLQIVSHGLVLTNMLFTSLKLFFQVCEEILHKIQNIEWHSTPAIPT
jgi:hypothetical protein